MLVCVFFVHLAHETAGAARTRHSLLPLFSRDNVHANLGHFMPREGEAMFVATQGAPDRCRRRARRSFREGGKPATTSWESRYGNWPTNG